MFANNIVRNRSKNQTINVNVKENYNYPIIMGTRKFNAMTNSINHSRVTTPSNNISHFDYKIKNMMKLKDIKNHNLENSKSMISKVYEDLQVRKLTKGELG